MSPIQPTTEEPFSNLDDLKIIEADCWKLLCAAPQDRVGGWRVPVLATSGEAVPRQRSVVLRHVDRESRKIFVHTDVRSPKVAVIRANPLVSWLFYDATRGVQVQLVGEATVQTSESDTQWLWDQEPVGSLRGYLAPYSPGHICDHRESNLLVDSETKLSRDDLARGRCNFGVICSTPKTLEVLVLRTFGSVRAIYSYENGSLISANWMAP